MTNHIEKFLELMKKERIDPKVQESFQKYYKQVQKGATGKLSESEIVPPQKKNLIDYEELTKSQDNLLGKLVVIKLNGGLGTSMGLKKAKSLLNVKDDLNFLDIISQQILFLRKEKQNNIPLLFMNSFNTREDTLNYLKKYNNLKIEGVPLDFIQNKFPKIRKDDLSPLKSKNENSNWNPPGHGEIYLAMQISGVLQQLLNKGIEYAFISNADNLGAVIDESILELFDRENIPFLMEVCRRTEMDKKGGHLAETKDGQLILREVAQCPDDEMAEFQNIEKYGYFNTNNLWINLKSLSDKIAENKGIIPLPLILNEKNVDGIDVYQIETAMGAAISIIENSKAVIVPRSRFLPVKKTNDLLMIWSDIYELRKDYSLVRSAGVKKNPTIELDEKFYKNIEQLQEHFRDEIPSLKKCQNLTIGGDVYFGKNVEFIGDVEIAVSMKTRIENRIFNNAKKDEQSDNWR
ncbi:MAG: UTP--glucose-1-phosphate uridylyltransferase [Candidatus Cloacimonetes bacterium]|nr:UTP--glucose-1-phosphate uridylyltransferase [Candidatus Cloacimonadota bacterium]